MKTIEITLYGFDELCEKGKEYAREQVRQWADFYPWHSENQESLKEFAKVLGGKATWSVQMSGYGPSYAKITDLPGYLTTPNEYLSEDSYRPTDWIFDNKETIESSCPFTGLHLDEYLLDPFRDYLENPNDRTFQELLDEALENWGKAYVNDWDHCYTDEYIDDFLVANDYTFYENGKIYR